MESVLEIIINVTRILIHNKKTLNLMEVNNEFNIRSNKQFF